MKKNIFGLYTNNKYKTIKKFEKKEKAKAKLLLKKAKLKLSILKGIK